MSYVLGIDIGTASSKAVAVDESGEIRATEQVSHEISRPRIGWAEHHPATWWSEMASLSRRVVTQLGESPAAVCVSGMGPCLAPATAAGEPVRAAILYGIDSRAEAEIAELSAEIGDDELLVRGGSLLSSQAVGPKILWLQRHEPEVWARTRRFFMPSSYAVWQLTGEYMLDHHSASQCNPLYDLPANRWSEEMVERVAPGIELPRLLWSSEVAGAVTASAAETTGLERGTPVLAGTIDAWAEAVSIGATEMGDIMLMYGSTMFLTKVVERGARSTKLWATAGVHEGTETLAAGMATGGIVATWFGKVAGQPLETLIAEAAKVTPGADGLLMLPYLAGERTPIFDPHARGLLIGLTLSHGRAEMMRAMLEGVALGVRHNLDAFDEVSAPATRYLAVGGGARTTIWPQIVSDVSGIPQLLPRHTVGAAFGDAMLAAGAAGISGLESWNPVEKTIEPNRELGPMYARLFDLYRQAYLDTREVIHALVAADQPRNIRAIPAEASPTDR
ncbi:MAG: FGGY-family carbohydrate kinase [Chloroflexi bacterium]|nr:FGGY-family carbohydrate kinase [Chloroflexota bacterium]